MMVLIWFLASFPTRRSPGTTDPAINYSLAALIGKGAGAGCSRRSASTGRSTGWR